MMELLEAITSAIGDELTLLSGFRSTRLTAQFHPERQIATAPLTAQSIDTGITITLSTGTFAPAVLGQRFRVLSGPFVGRSAIITAVTGGSTQLTLASPGIGYNFSAASWEIVADADTSMQVETALDWDASGAVYLDGVKYDYASRTDSTLDSITHGDRQRARGVVVCIAGNLINEGEHIYLPDGYGNAYTLEFVKTSQARAGNVAVQISNGDTAAQVRDKLIAVIRDLEPFRVSAFENATAQIDLIHNEEGVQGNVAITETVANTGFLVLGLTGGAESAPGAKQLHDTLAEVVDFSLDYSSLDAYRRALLVEFATGEDLNIIGRNYGIDRPPALDDDEIYRAIIRAVAYGPRGTLRLIEQILTAALGANAWETFEDAASQYLTLNGVTRFPYTTSRHHNTIFLRREDNNETNPNGKTFLDGGELRPMTSTTTLALGMTPKKLVSLHLADDQLQERLVATGTQASSSNFGATITGPGGSFPARIEAGDIFEITSGRYAGRRGIVATVTPTTQITTAVVEGAPYYKLNTNFSRVSYKIWRRCSSFRYNKPSDDISLEYSGDTGTTMWTAVVAGGASEGVNATVVSGSPASGGRYTKIAFSGAGQTLYYKHLMRIHEESEATFGIVARADGTPSTTSTKGMQWFIQMNDGKKRMTVGLIATATPSYKIGFVDPSTGSFIGTPKIEYTDLTEWKSLRIVKTGGKNSSARRVQLLLDGNVVDELAYSNAGFVSTTDTELRFGKLDTSVSAIEMKVKSASWSCRTARDFNNTHVAGGTTNTTNHLVDGGSGGLFAVGDVGKRVRIHDFAATNSGGGNCRGEWEIATRVSANDVTVVGPQRFRGRFVGTAYPSRFVVDGDPNAFTWPDNLGHQLVIENGPNAGAYSIDHLLNPTTLVPFETSLLLTNTITPASGATVPVVRRTNVLDILGNFPAPADDTIVTWHLAPNFPVDAGPVPYEIVDTSTVAGANVTLRQAVPFAGGFLPVLETDYSSVLTGQLHDTDDANALVSPGVYHLYPFYLYDNWGWLRDLIDVITAAGVIPDFDSMTRDAAGIHLQA